ncbi:hypothetical protein M422DRAFT_275929 [Sphaerobolus stellatus SS14]|uniref:Uncharacterized protein n=1 Tax=Sphaerobolus stellatus (strain SS14) TaxID=990650 RepID=A0A0C9UDI7_SPHS4|nr:hypothetical protein M422DRAFT_275929 [Sphaerobolus stellatus SS14]
MPQDPIDEQEQQQSEEQFANTLCNHFAVFQHLWPWEWSPLAYLASHGFVHGIKLCIACGWDVNKIHVGERQCVFTPLSRAMSTPLSRRLAVATVLLEHGTTDVIHMLQPSGYVIQCSPALRHMLFLHRFYPLAKDRNLHEHVIRLLLDHRSLINSPYYEEDIPLVPSTFAAFKNPKLEWAPQLLSEYGGCLDLVFPRPDGLLDSFTGEFMESCVTEYGPRYVNTR